MAGTLSAVPEPERLADRPEEGNYALEFVVAGAVGLIRAWLERGAQESPEEMAQLTGQLILSGVYSQAPEKAGWDQDTPRLLGKCFGFVAKV